MATTQTHPNVAGRHIDPRLQLRRLRVSFTELVIKTPEPRHPWADVTRKEPRSSLPFEKEREMIHTAIRQGCTTPERVVAWRLAQLRDDLGQFPTGEMDIDTLLYTNAVREQAEAINAQSLAHAVPTQTNREAAIRETEEAVSVSRVLLHILRSGRQLLHLDT